MGMFAEECLWMGWRCLTVILAAALVAEIGQPHLKLGVAAQLPSLAPAPSPVGQLADVIESQLDDAIQSIANNYADCFNEADLADAFATDGIADALIQCVTNTSPTHHVSSLCQSEELREYFTDLPRMKDAGVRPNSNCNSSNWPRGCDAGWAAVDLANGSVPGTTPCCAGFFCPPGLTCMIPCPLGAYCPAATTDTNFYQCQPYGYPSRPPGNYCGGADIWVNYKDSPGIFCQGGQYCPDALTQNVCQKSHFCRLGSTVQTKCMILGHCGSVGMKQENLQTYGTLMMVLLSVSLLVIYTCSDQLMHIRDRRKSKARDLAAREARETVSAAERWKRAKERAKEKAKSVARKAAIMFSGEIPPSPSSTMSKKRPSRSRSTSSRNLNVEIRPLSSDQDTSPELDRRRRPGRQGDEELGRREQALDGHTEASAGVVRGSSHEAWSHDLYPVEIPRSMDLYDATQMSPVPSSGGLQKGDGLPAVKQMDDIPRPWKPLVRTRSKIYKYAYAEIEKEKTKQQQHSKHTSLKELVTADGFDNLLLGPERFKMEISFVDLCLILKGSRKKILSFVTGKLSPGRVTAVMGPSGAGKTTFLNALAGKEAGSVITGQVFINGVPGSIQSYKRIIGFVPQDDIVHGTLTVEENLNFSAKYRLPVGTRRQDRVLVVERIINRLNLTSVRQSLVGTVENRGISGGQRKRVNVGLELVIEPSVLLLDEPTSGLDSTSSRLVVQSLRREAALGVNVCLVVHQPSYGLFKMFDDVLMLARGGYTVYLGPTPEIEAYFSSYGFEVPDRMNPPEYYMDVLEGVLMPDDRNQSFDLSSLPVLWMCHKGFHIPLELQRTTDGTRMQQGDPSRLSYHNKSLVHEVWDELRVWVLVRLDILQVAVSSVKNLSGRQTPGFFAQYFLILGRVTKQRFRESRLVAQDYIILLLAGISLARLSDWKDEEMGGEGYLYTLITIALLIMIASLRTFSSDKLQFWRESSSGVNRLAFFLAKDTVDHFNTLLKPAIYLFMFYFYNYPRSTFFSNYITTLALVYCCTGIAYILAIVLKPQPAQLLCVFLPVLTALLASEPRKGFLQKIQRLTYAFWALQAYIIANAEKYTGVWLITRCVILRKGGYSIHNYNRCIGVLMGYGVGARIVAFICLTLFHRKRQK